MDQFEQVRQLAHRHLASLERRYRHVEAVASRAADLVRVLPPNDRPAVVTAAWLHDIGYAPTISVTGFHPLDGADYLDRLGIFPEVVVQLVAHHTGAVFEADERGLLDRLAVYPEPPEKLLNVLTAADMLTGPGGQPVEPSHRIAETLQRYPPADPVYRAVSRSGPQLIATVHAVLAQLTS